jgi:hypothetical protein
MAEDSAYTPADLRYAVNSAALLGWMGVAGWSLWPDWGLLPFAAVIGLPIAFAACWLIGAPVLRRAMRRPLSYPRAASLGGLIAVLFALSSIAIGRFRGWMESVDDTFSSQWGYGEYLRSVDGILTTYGWLLVLQNSLILVVMGAAIGVFIRAKIGAGR